MHDSDKSMTCAQQMFGLDGSTLSCLQGKWPIQNTVIITYFKYIASHIGLSLTFLIGFVYLLSCNLTVRVLGLSNLEDWHSDQNEVGKLGAMRKNKSHSGLTGFSIDTGGRINCSINAILLFCIVFHISIKKTNQYEHFYEFKCHR